MNTKYRFILHVELPNRDRLQKAFVVDGYAAKQFEPYDLCSDAMTAFIADGVTSAGAARIDAEREGLAKEISARLTAAILEAIKSRDLRNGYEQNSKASERGR